MNILSGYVDFNKDILLFILGALDIYNAYDII